MNRKIFRAIFFSILVSLILALGAVLFIAHEAISGIEQDRLGRINAVISSGYNHLGIDFIKQSSNEESLYRITLIDPDGKVIYDSKSDEPLDNHQDRTEVVQALAQGTGSAERYSDTLNTQTYYYARILNDGRILRVSITTDNMLMFTVRLTAYFALILAVFGALALFTSSKISDAIVEPLNRIDLNHPLLSDCYEEIRPFLSEIDKKQRQLDRQMQLMRSKNEEFLTITKSMAEGLVLLNRDGIILTINKTAKKIFNITDDCIGKSFMAIERGEQAREFFNPQSKVTKRSCTIEKDGRDYHLRFSQIRVDGNVLGYALIILDVTETKRAEEQRQEFTANVSHELKTPLQSIIGSAELIESGIVKPADLTLFAGRIRKQGVRLISLIEDIIFLSSLDEGSGNAIFEPVALNKVVNEVFEVLTPKAQEREVTLKTEGPALVIPAVYRYIYEMIYNLCDNAINYNRPQGSVTVHFEEHENKLIIAVIDTGIGIAKEHISRIFERFYRVDKSHSRQTGGTGLGLSIVKRTVLFHHGKIKLKSEVGVGSTFKITLYKKELAKLSAPKEPTREPNSPAQIEAHKAAFFNSH
ncbi:MAG: PAS domain S-box protein [Candidatus Anaerobiospirillum merdipullorum]|uniref:histidine kinase n=1 Tax=Candidatus Anaerobiospirillum merdipullorum TaxID=2838450 RepID=A0A9E2KQ73_9GAMM|nr:PAS domain S-box protein [Candidatus Anaerobiospirillum merdipullorum]